MEAGHLLLLVCVKLTDQGKINRQTQSHMLGESRIAGSISGVESVDMGKGRRDKQQHHSQNTAGLLPNGQCMFQPDQGILC